ncbi:MAG: hypothetical protein U1C70_04975 [Sediminibacterium sp.]|uniref:hypothetical protein n=1 Tax=Sediminibacterium sp. TaxID=1917865 RepID=UPI002ABA15F6|nr:hypothetical protein [Sediminibacterium sp.]MDZ4071158.1 hypothetical protein [Sediminibacterium sp.]
MGIIGNLLCSILYIFLNKKNQVRILLLKTSAWLASIIGLIGFIVIGAVYTLFTQTLKLQMNSTLAVILISIFIISVTYFTNKQHKELLDKVSNFSTEELMSDNGKMPYSTFIQMTNRFILSTYGWLPISYLVFLLLPGYAEKITFGLGKILLNLIR